VCCVVVARPLLILERCLLSRAKRGIGSRETLCHDIYPAWPITTVYLAANTYCMCMMDGLSSSEPRTIGSRVQFSGACELMTGQRIQQEAICYQWFKQGLILSVSKPSISQRSQIKDDTSCFGSSASDNLLTYQSVYKQC